MLSVYGKVRFVVNKDMINTRGRDDLKCAPLTGCGTQHPHRALGGTCVLLAAAPTTPPCFRHWRRSSSLHFGHIQRKDYFKFRVCRALRSAPNAIFTGGIGNELPQSKPTGFDSSLREGAFGMAVLFPAEAQSLRACSLPLGGAVAQRLRGYRWRSEKSVKALAPTGAALAFLCFDFFFRIVKGV